MISASTPPMTTWPFFSARRAWAKPFKCPKQFTLRLQLEYAAAQLVVSTANVLDVALESGFESHDARRNRLHQHHELRHHPKTLRNPLPAVQADDLSASRAEPSPGAMLTRGISARHR